MVGKSPSNEKVGYSGFYTRWVTIIIPINKRNIRKISISLEGRGSLSILLLVSDKTKSLLCIKSIYCNFSHERSLLNYIVFLLTLKIAYICKSSIE